MFLDDLQNFLGCIHGTGDQLLGTYRGAQAAGSADRVVDGCQIVLHLDSIMGTNLHAQTAADTALAASTDCDRALCVRCAGDNHVLFVIYGNDQVTGTLLGTSHTTGTLITVEEHLRLCTLALRIMTPHTA